MPASSGRINVFGWYVMPNTVPRQTPLLLAGNCGREGYRIVKVMPALGSRKTLFGLICLAAFADTGLYQEVLAAPALSVSVLSVGKGDAFLVQAPHGALVLIDTGPDAEILRALGEKLPEWRRRIDVVVLTSSSIGSAGGLSAVLSRYRVGTLVRSGARGSDSMESVLRVAEKRQPHLRAVLAERGERLSLGGGAYADFLWPDAAATDNVKNAVVALRLSYGSTSFLLKRALPPHVAAWLDSIDGAEKYASAFALASITPPATFVSNGAVIRRLR